MQARSTTSGQHAHPATLGKGGLTAAACVQPKGAAVATPRERAGLQAGGPGSSDGNGAALADVAELAAAIATSAGSSRRVPTAWLEAVCAPGAPPSTVPEHVARRRAANAAAELTTAGAHSRGEAAVARGRQLESMASAALHGASLSVRSCGCDGAAPGHQDALCPREARRYEYDALLTLSDQALLTLAPVGRSAALAVARAAPAIALAHSALQIIIGDQHWRLFTVPRQRKHCGVINSARFMRNAPAQQNR